MYGELNFTKCGDRIKITSRNNDTWIDIEIGDLPSTWLILTVEQAKRLRAALNKTFKEDMQ